ncbi:flagellar cap protein FliD N-terminal domain-containing protein, partial [Klebsiella pneumoniae]|uniref:flagellar cap protein FliD N-terminal domain-containing protein n=1 Tax=Klebsiella pneumoniae TaxID=573 RepID=UPI0039C42DC1
ADTPDIMDSLNGTSGSIASPGIGSGLNVNDMVQKLLDLDSQPLKIIQLQGQRLQTQLSAVGQLQSLVGSLQAATTPLTTASNYSLTTATTSDPSVVSAATSGGAVAGTYSVAVTQLA